MDQSELSTHIPQQNVKIDFHYYPLLLNDRDYKNMSKSLRGIKHSK